MEITLFAPYFRPKEAERRRELLLSLEQNRRCSAINHIFLMIDDDAEVNIDDGQVTVIPMAHRPTYADWVRLSYEHRLHGVSVLANADIYFDDSLAELVRLYQADPTAFVALSRHELIRGSTVPHPNPHWSQDVWAFLPQANVNPVRDSYLNIPLGVPRCDNKVAYVFGVSGHAVYNPYNEVRSVHVHETGLRNYDKKGDARVFGAVALVHPSGDLLTPAKLDIQVWPLKNAAQFGNLSLNPTLERWAKQALVGSRAGSAPVPATALMAGKDDDIHAEPGVLGYDAHWLCPAITEKAVFEQVRLFAPRRDGLAYIGFPWASLIEGKRRGSSDAARLQLLENKLRRLAELASSYDRVVTACQHARLLQFPHLFSDAGVTDIFWSHAASDQDHLPGRPDITFHPLPLYPVQVAEGPEIPINERELLFSFIGSSSRDDHLSQTRSFLIEDLAGDPRGLIINRDTCRPWKTVSNAQIQPLAEGSEGMVDDQVGEQFREALSQSKFSLCPSGSGPNSTRLWEAIMTGAIPVILADTYRRPGDGSLWDLATVSCGEERDSIRALPDRLEAIAANPAEMRRRRTALSLLALRYGRDNLGSDVLAFMQRVELKKAA